MIAIDLEGSTTQMTIQNVLHMHCMSSSGNINNTNAHFHKSGFPYPFGLGQFSSVATMDTMVDCGRLLEVRSVAQVTIHEDCNASE